MSGKWEHDTYELFDPEMLEPAAKMKLEDYKAALANNSPDKDAKRELLNDEVTKDLRDYGLVPDGLEVRTNWTHGRLLIKLAPRSKPLEYNEEKFKTILGQMVRLIPRVTPLKIEEGLSTFSEEERRELWNSLVNP